tara:strand:- start:386 stop:769 length:384 start_codon:yes stop_codon:yes gene_type:complete
MNRRAELIRLAYGSTLIDGGYTLWEDDSPRYRGFVVGGMAHESVCERTDYKSFEKLFEEYRDILRTDPRNMSKITGIGSWHEDDKIYFDIVQLCDTREEAIKWCKFYSEKAYFDILEQKSIYIKYED